MKHVLTQLCQQVRAARESSTPLYIQGGNTKQFYGEPVQAHPGASANAQTLDLSPYTGVLNYEPSELVITARAGTPLSEIEQTLAQQGQALSFEPPRFGAASTLGGCVASGLSGPRRMAAGSLSDFVLGARLLHSSGEVLSFGGEVMKNVAGYDVSRLLAGSMGSLGPIVELSIKVMPVPACEQTQKLAVSETEALALQNTWRGLPLPISATAWLADSRSENHCLYVRVSGSEPAVTSAVAQIGGDPVDAADSLALWNSLRDQTHPFFQNRPLWRIAVPPTTQALDLGPAVIEWGGGLRWVTTEMPAHELRRKVETHKGYATLYRYEHTPTDIPVFHPLSNVLQQINRRMMEQFDPVGIFNPGRLFPAIKG